MAPVKKFQVWTKYAAWLSEDTKNRIKERDEAQQAAAIREGVKKNKKKMEFSKLGPPPPIWKKKRKKKKIFIYFMFQSM